MRNMEIRPYKILFSCIKPNTAIRLTRADTARASHPKVEKIVKVTWKDYEKQKFFSSFYSDSILRLDGFRETDNGFEILVNRTTYKEFLGTNVENPWIYNRYGSRFLSNPLVVSALIATEDGNLVFGLRGMELATDTGKTDAFGSFIKFSDFSAAKPFKISDAITENLRKMTGLSPAAIASVSCLGLVRNRTTLKPELLFSVRLSLNTENLMQVFSTLQKHTKYVNLVTVPDTADSLRTYLAKNQRHMTHSLQAGIWLYASRRKYWSTIQRIPGLAFSRAVTPKTALVLGGGFAKGSAHIGVLKMLEEIGLKIDLIVGNSIGALMGALYAAKGTYEFLEKTAREFKWKMISDWDLPKISLFKGKKLEKYLSTKLVYQSFSELAIPMVVTATDLRSGDEIALCGKEIAEMEKGELTGDPVFPPHKVVFMKAPLAQSIRASCAVPGIFSPVSMNARALCDGLIVDNIPVRIARMLGAKFIIAVDLSCEGEAGEIDNIIQIILRSQSLQDREMAALQLYGADVVIHPDLSAVNFTDFSNASVAIQRGYEAARGKVKEMRQKFGKKTKRKLIF
jgi:NTE family protein